MLCLAPAPGTPTALPADEVNPNLAPTAGPQCPVCGSGNTYTETDGNMTTWIVCQNPGCGARSC